MKLIDGDALSKETGKLWEQMPDGEELSKELMKAINRAPDAVVRCCECKNWDSDSGLTARMCYEWRNFTTQFEFCSRGEKHDS